MELIEAYNKGQRVYCKKISDVYVNILTKEIELTLIEINPMRVAQMIYFRKDIDNTTLPIVEETPPTEPIL